MRTINGFFCVLLGGFALAQYNDPDAVLWGLIYGIPAVWAGLAAFRPGWLALRPPAIAAYLVCLAAAVAGSLYLWPSLPADWIHIETEREGLGVIILTLALASVGVAWWAASRTGRPTSLAE